MNSINFEFLKQALPIISKVSLGYATITDKKGERLITVNSSGEVLENLNGIYYPLAKQSAEKTGTCLWEVSD